jgi:asparagine synthase (glutamine-hydrolysing)
MCGIVAVVSRQITEEHRCLFEKALSCQQHRGPDSSHSNDFGNLLLGHNRLAIIDLQSEADQPMNFDNFWISYNGEIYNFLEIRAELVRLGVTFKTKSDTEVLLKGYIQWGEKVLIRLRGMFSFIIWDETEKSLFAARDRFGEKPLLYAVIESDLFIASEMKTITRLIGKKLKIDLKSLNLYLHYQFVPEPLTLFSEVRKLPAGHFIRFNVDSYDSDPIPFWTQTTVKTGERVLTPLEEKKLITDYRDKLFDSVSRCFVSDTPVALSLSAGVDSGAIAAIARKLFPNSELHAFTLGYPGKSEIDERAGAQKLADELGITLHSIEVSTRDFVGDFKNLIRALDEPIADPAAYPHYLVPKQASRLGFKVILNGIGGDEFNWGYWWLKDAILRNKETGAKLVSTKSSSFFSRSRMRLKTGLGGVRKANIQDNNQKQTPKEFLHFYGELSEFNDVFNLTKANYQTQSYDAVSETDLYSLAGSRPSQTKDIPLAIVNALAKTWLTSNCLSLADRVGMSSSIETRMPFLDADLVDFSLGIMQNYDDYLWGQKYILKKALEGIVPAWVLEREKTGFRIPNHDWIGSIIGEFGDSLVKGNLVSQGIINSETISELLSSNDKSWQKYFFLYKLILVELWFDMLWIEE